MSSIRVRQNSCGAVVTFLGTVRDVTGATVTTALEYEAYPGMAEMKMREIEADVRQRWRIGEVAMVHRLGRLEVGDIAVAVAVSGAAPARSVRGVPARHRSAQGTGADLEEGNEPRRLLRVDSPGHMMRPLPLTPTSELVDKFGRRHHNLRISVTDRCNLRCSYCMPEEVTFLDRAELLTFEEIERFVRIAASLGVDKVRLTGGEPLLRRDLHRLVARIAAVPGIRDLGLTTNGLLLASQARALFDAGLRRINISPRHARPGPVSAARSSGRPSIRSSPASLNPSRPASSRSS